MSASRRDTTSIQPARSSTSARVFLAVLLAWMTPAWMAVAVFVGGLLLTRSEAAAQSADAAQKTASASAGNAQHGKAVYTRVGCYECHGSDAQSGRPTLGPSAIPFAAFMRQVRVPRNDMPPYTAKVLSDADVADIYAFVQSVPQPPKVDSVPLLK